MSIHLSHVRKSYGPHVAVHDLTLDIPAGNVVAFLGRNGAGKTTTMKMIVGLLLADAGTIEVCGHPMGADGRAAKSVIAYVPDQPYLYDKLTAREFLDFVGRIYGMDSAAARQKAEALFERLDMNDYVDELSESYSHGMKQRAVLAAALLHEPRVLVVDEPMVGLDPRTVRTVKEMFREQAAAGRTVFMSTHTLDVAESAADRIAIIHHGRLVAEGTLAHLRDQAAESSRLEDIFLQLTDPTAESLKGPASGFPVMT